MPSLRSRMIRLLIKYLIAPKFRRAGTSIPKWRELDDFMLKSQRIPKGTEIAAATINGMAAEWVRAPGVDTENALLYLHGGAFVCASPATHREIAARFSAATGSPALVIGYRLAPEHSFPAALEDALSAYHWLLENGYSSRKLVIGGDSAGGGLTLQTLLALRDAGGQMPAAAFMLSPVADWVRFDGESYETRAASDPMIEPGLCRFTAGQYVGNNDPETPLLYPVGMDLSGLPPLCIHVGDREVLLSDSVRLAARARAAGVNVRFKVWPGMWHFFQASARMVPEARQSIAEISRFLSEQKES